ncbi:MAG TPA: aminodeoxychorismate synthase component I [Candidatus Krumholzibacteria bacterium]|nr:aminodeoxychorismate synthase component I [Candidatus Krumholzibacteria bacterium]HPD70835.1 aminodeoxychorismate synthase component I [Candidatus Krumholzibacteria bacterium]HRY39465.1 aminodeoxychorismate synthase component I [Candidatus Krumholzibacteria bacterium]
MDPTEPVPALSHESIAGVHVERVDLPGDFLDAAARFAPLRGTVILASGGDHDCARHHVLGSLPWLTLTARGGGGELEVDGGRTAFTGDPLSVLRRVLDHHRLPGAVGRGDAPIRAGLLGYLSYDLKDHLESLPRSCVDDLELPTMLLFAPSVLLVQDRRTLATHVVAPSFANQPGRAAASIARCREILAGPLPLADPPVAGVPVSNLTRLDYEQSVREILGAIAAGDVYQVNLSQRFRSAFAGDPYALFARAFAANPAPFFAYVQGGDHQVISTSPERFLHRAGDVVESRPIKGTRPRGDTPAADRALADELLRSAKDDAELTMIVDLVRNDLGKVCRPGSVLVPEHRRLESYRNVHHLVSVVTGRLEPGRDSVDLVRAAFPGGSVTGCPKIRAMEIIDRLEPHRRHVYCGSIGYLGFDETLDLSIAIRTATVAGGTLTWSVGGAVVHDSDPGQEYEESLHKGRTLAEVCAAPAATAATGPIAWHNGRLVPLGEASVPVTDLGLRRGYGLFETLRVDRGRAPLLDDHVARFNSSWLALMPSRPPDLGWADVIAQVTAANRLDDRPTLVRILATRGSRDQAPWDHSLTVTAEPYTHRLALSGARGLRLGCYPDRRQNPLAAHKTLSYILNARAGLWARAHDLDEALILNPDGTVSEGNSTGVLAISGLRAIRPESPAALPSVMAAAVCRQLSAWGYTVETAPLRPGDLMRADHALAMSALMGAVPIIAIDGHERPDDDGLWRRLNDAILPGWDAGVPC